MLRSTFLRVLEFFFNEVPTLAAAEGERNEVMHERVAGLDAKQDLTKSSR